MLSCLVMGAVRIRDSVVVARADREGETNVGGLKQEANNLLSIVAFTTAELAVFPPELLEASHTIRERCKEHAFGGLYSRESMVSKSPKHLPPFSGVTGLSSSPFLVPSM